MALPVALELSEDRLSSASSCETPTQSLPLSATRRLTTSESETIEEEATQVTPSLSTDTVDTPRCRPVTSRGRGLTGRESPEARPVARVLPEGLSKGRAAGQCGF